MQQQRGARDTAHQQAIAAVRGTSRALRGAIEANVTRLNVTIDNSMHSYSDDKVNLRLSRFTNTKYMGVDVNWDAWEDEDTGAPDYGRSHICHLHLEQLPSGLHELRVAAALDVDDEPCVYLRLPAQPNISLTTLELSGCKL